MPKTSTMLLQFIKLALPSILTNVLAFVSNIVIIVFAGQLDDPIYVAAIGLSLSFNVVMISSLMIGLNAAQETLTSQAFGAKNLQLCGLYLNRGMLILICFYVPISLVPYIFGEKIFIAIG